MKRLVLAASILAFGTAAASAADLAPRYYKAPPPVVAAAYDWSGFYAGINGGWGTSHNCYTNTAVAGIAFPPAGEGCHDADGGTVGGQIGYRWQASNWVFGLEAQGNWADFSGSNTSVVFPGVTNHTRMDAFGLFTGQIGYAWNNVLLYAKGGAAVTDTKFDAITAGIVTASTGDQTRWGATVGAGLEVGFAPNWSVGVEYDHIFMDGQNRTFTTPAGIVLVDTFRDTGDVDMVTARVNYRWGGPVIAKY
jgi:outer membrane immunogenic protein